MLKHMKMNGRNCYTFSHNYLILLNTFLYLIRPKNTESKNTEIKKCCVRAVFVRVRAVLQN